MAAMESHARGRVALAYFAIGFSFLTLLPPTFFTQLVPPFQIVLIATILYSVSVFVRACSAGYRSGFVIGFGFVVLGVSILHDVLLAHGVGLVDTAYVLPVGMLVFVLSQALVLALRFGESFVRIRELSHDLQLTNTAYSHFVPNEFLRFLGKDNIVDIELGDATERQMGVLFVDIRSFTQLSERMTPEEAFRFLNSYFHKMGPVIRGHNGFVDKYIGDGIMALFPDSPDNAVNAAIEMQWVLGQYNQELEATGNEMIAAGIGLHYGDMMLGTIGETERMDGTVISDAMNIAARLQSLAGQYRIGILVTDWLLDRCDQTQLLIRDLGSTSVKGRREPVPVSEICNAYPEPKRELLKATLDDFEKGIAALRTGDLDEATDAFSAVIETDPSDITARRLLDIAMKRKRAGERM